MWIGASFESPCADSGGAGLEPPGRGVPPWAQWGPAGRLKGGRMLVVVVVVVAVAVAVAVEVGDRRWV